MTRNLYWKHWLAFAIVVVALIWLYVCWLILLGGAQVSFYWQNPEHLRLGYRPLSLGSRQREQIALSLMTESARAFRDGVTHPTIADIGEKLRLPGLVLLPVIHRLESAGLITRSNRDRLMPGRDPAGIRLIDVVAAVREPQATDIFPEGSWPGCVRTISTQLSEAVEGALGNRSLYDLLELPRDN